VGRLKDCPVSYLLRELAPRPYLQHLEVLRVGVVLRPPLDGEAAYAIVEELPLGADGVCALRRVALLLAPCAPCRLTPEGHRPLGAAQITAPRKTVFNT